MQKFEIKNLCVKSGEHMLVDGVSFTLQTGKITALVGKSGSGKTLSALALLELMPPNLIATLQIHGTKPDLAIVMQNPRTAFNPIVKIKDHFLETYKSSVKNRLKSASNCEIVNIIDDALRDVELDPALKERYAFELSGGQLQRIMIALALFSGAKFIIADEPTTDLDLLVQAKILELLKHLVSEHELGLLLITHDLSVVANMADEVLVMSGGKIVERGACKQIFKTPTSNAMYELLNANLLLYKDSL